MYDLQEDFPYSFFQNQMESKSFIQYLAQDKQDTEKGNPATNQNPCSTF